MSVPARNAGNHHAACWPLALSTRSVSEEINTDTRKGTRTALGGVVRVTLGKIASSPNGLRRRDTADEYREGILSKCALLERHGLTVSVRKKFSFPSPCSSLAVSALWRMHVNCMAVAVPTLSAQADRLQKFG